MNAQRILWTINFGVKKLHTLKLFKKQSGATEVLNTGEGVAMLYLSSTVENTMLRIMI